MRIAPILFAVCSLAAAEVPAPARLHTEYLRNPLGIDAAQPRFGWWMRHTGRNQEQTAYQILLATAPEKLAPEKTDVWDSGRVDAARNVHVVYQGPALESGTRYSWTVRLWDKDGQASAWAEPAWFETALLHPEDFEAQWIRPESGLGDSLGYRSAPQRRAKSDLTVTLDLGEPHEIAAVTLYPARVSGHDGAYGFPEWYRVECADDADFGHAHEVAEVRRQDDPGRDPVRLDIKPRTARYVRLSTVRLSETEEDGHLLALAEITVEDTGGRNLAYGVPVQTGSSDDGGAWSTACLVDGVLKSETKRSISPLLRTEFTLKPGIRSARAYASAMGYYELFLNGRRVGDHVLDPGNTVEDKRRLYSVYDVTDLLREGANAAGVMLGHGWHFGPCAAWLQLRVAYADGSTDTLTTHPGWRAAEGPILDESLFGGETYDARRERPGWRMPGFDDSGWGRTKLYEEPPAALSCQAMPPIRITREVKPVSITPREEGAYIVDFGWNLTGWLRIQAEGPRGATLTLRHAELLHDDGSLNTDTLETARATDVYVLKGGARETYAPRFTQHGFRYAEVRGYPGELTAEDVTACVVHTDFDEVGAFACSSELFNDIRTITRRSILGNSMSIPTDCPQRGERMGWLGDVHLVVEPTLHLFDACAWYESYLRSIADEQNEDGTIPDTVPHYMFGEKDGSPAWAVCYPLLTWYLYRYCGDERVVRQHYPNIVRWFETLERKAEGHLLEKAMYGDWVGVEGTPGPIIASGVYYWTADVLAEFARFLERDADAARFEQRKTGIAEAFNRELYDAERGCYGNGSQFSQVWPLYLGIVPEERKAGTLAHLRTEIVDHRGGHLATGILGTKYLFDVLSDHGLGELAYTVAMQEDYPGWGYMLKMGATTLWERWEYMTGRDMNSHNHQMYGSIAGWFFDEVAGIQALPEPGYRHFVIAPLPAKQLDSASAHTHTVAGPIRVDWQREDGLFTLEAEVPPNTTARVVLPVNGAQVTMNGEAAGQQTEFDVGSGQYKWTAADKRDTE